MKIVVLGGGVSTERHVALVTGTSVCRALRSLGHQAIFVDLYMGLENYDGPLEDGHNNTALSIGVVDAGEERYKAFREYTWSRFDDYEITEFTRKMSEVTEGIYSARSEDYSREGYYKYGDTAIILLNEFSVSGENWKEYYRNGGELPDDTMGKAAKGLMRAAEDAEIRNVVFDLGTNPGGYSDAVAGVISLMTGRDYLCGFNELSKQSFRVPAETCSPSL